MKSLLNYFSAVSVAVSILGAAGAAAAPNAVRDALTACLKGAQIKAVPVDGNDRHKLTLSCGSQDAARALFQASIAAGAAEAIPARTWQYGHRVEQANFDSEKSALISRCFHDLDANTWWCGLNLDVSPGTTYIWNVVTKWNDKTVSLAARAFQASLLGCFFTSTPEFRSKGALVFKCTGEQAQRLYQRARGFISQDEVTGTAYRADLPMGYLDGKTVVFGCDDEKWYGREPGPGAQCYPSSQNAGQFECELPVKLGREMMNALR